MAGMAVLAGCGGQSPIASDGFEDGIHHYRSRVENPNYTRYSPEQYKAVAQNLLLMQRANGGWRENMDPFKVLSEEEREQLNRDQSLDDTSFDNNNTYPQVAYLYEAYERSGNVAFRDAAYCGLLFILEQQTLTGGWTHSPPRNHTWRGYITFADDVMPGILHCLREVSTGAYPFMSVDIETRKRAAEALRKGEALILKLQLRRDGKLGLWAGQYDAVTLEPRGARSFELPAIVVRESVSTLRYLMSIDDPPAEVIAAIEGGVAWLRENAIEGMRIEEVEAPWMRWEYHGADFDRVVVEDPDAPRIWARFYGLDDQRPFMANRDGTKVFRLSEVKRERRTGYDWYGYWPESLLEQDYPEWCDRLER